MRVTRKRTNDAAKQQYLDFGQWKPLLMYAKHQTTFKVYGTAVSNISISLSQLTSFVVDAIDHLAHARHPPHIDGRRWLNATLLLGERTRLTIPAIAQ
jgi:hypothetical protein